MQIWNSVLQLKSVKKKSSQKCIEEFLTVQSVTVPEPIIATLIAINHQLEINIQSLGYIKIKLT